MNRVCYPARSGTFRVLKLSVHWFAGSRLIAPVCILETRVLHPTAIVPYILVVAASRFAGDAMKSALAKRGHTVIAATDFRQVEQSCKDMRFDLVVIGEAVPSRIKKALILELRKYCIGAPILEVCASQPCMAEADYLLQSDSYDTLAQRIHEILQSKPRRKRAQG